MKDWRRTLIPPSHSIHDAIKAIDSSAIQTVFVIDNESRLLGTVTDGDIRRAILKSLSLEEPVKNIMNTSPIIARHGDSQENILVTMKLTSLRHIPILDEQGRVVNVAQLDDLLQTEDLDNWVVLMAGGLGSRLRPLTNDCPKPLLKVGNKPILETIMENCRNYGFRQFVFSINYKAEMIKEYFGNGSSWGVRINYLEERKKLGTAGALSLLAELPDKPIVVVNGDLLTKVNFQHLLDFHRQHMAQATMCVREYNFQVPYGVVDVQDQRIKDIKEKPNQRFLVNAGIYVLEPETINLIPRNTFFDMPDLFKWLIERSLTTAAFPIREYWVDIGQLPDLERAKNDFDEEFRQDHFKDAPHIFGESGQRVLV